MTLHRQTIQAMADELAVPEADFRRCWGETRGARETGEFANIEANMRSIAQTLGSPAKEAKTYSTASMYRRLQYAAEPREDAEATLATLRRKGFRIGLISDCSPGIPELWRGFSLAPYVEQPVFSFEVGMKKPDARIYRLACERLGVSPQECLYVGDGGSHELTGAKSVGMSPVRITVPDQENVVRVDVEDWPGSTISTLVGVLTLLGID